MARKQQSIAIYFQFDDLNVIYIHAWGDQSITRVKITHKTTKLKIGIAFIKKNLFRKWELPFLFATCRKQRPLILVLRFHCLFLFLFYFFWSCAFMVFFVLVVRFHCLWHPQTDDIDFQWFRPVLMFVNVWPLFFLIISTLIESVLLLMLTLNLIVNLKWWTFFFKFKYIFSPYKYRIF